MAGTCRDIHEASKKGDKVEVERFIRAGVDVNKKDKKGELALRLAAQGGHTDIVKLLLDNGANIDEKGPGGTAVQKAAAEGHIDTVKLFLNQGANIHEKNDQGLTPIYWASRCNHTEIVKLLLKHGANIDEKAIDGLTPISGAAWEGHTDTVRFLLSAGADPYISGGETVLAIWRDMLKRDWSKQTEEKILSSYSSKENYKVYIAAALAQNKQDFLMKFIKKVSEKKEKVVESLLTKDAEDISNLLAFIRRQVTRKDGVDTTDKKIKMLIGGEGGNRFYLVKTKVLGDKSLIQYIAENGPRMIMQREDLIDLLAKCVEHVDSEKEIEILDPKEIELKIINNLKLGLPSSRGLTECIKMTEEKFKWSFEKLMGLYFFSIFLSLLSTSLYIMDVYTDGKFVLEMWDNSQKNFTILNARCLRDFYTSGPNNTKNDFDRWSWLCKWTWKIDDCIEFLSKKALEGQKCREIGPRFEDPHKFTQRFWYSLIHCIAPIVWTFCVSLHIMKTMKVSNLKKIPSPLITRFFALSKNLKKILLRGSPNFEKRIPEIEAQITEYEDSINLSSGIEAATEAGSQFFFQAVYFLPNLILNLLRLTHQSSLWSVKSMF